MVGRDLIIYILENGLENEPIFEDGKFIGFKTMLEVAKELDVGIETVRAWAQLSMIPYVAVGGIIYIPANYEPPMKK